MLGKLKRAVFWCGAGLASLTGLLLLGLILVAYRPEVLRPVLERWVTPPGGRAGLADLEVALWPPCLTLKGLVVEGPSGSGDFTRVEEVSFHPRASLLIFKGPWFRRIEAKGLTLQRESLPPAGPEGGAPLALRVLAWLLDVEELVLTDARIRLALPQGVLAADFGVALTPAQEGGRRSDLHGDVNFHREGRTLARGEIVAQGQIGSGPELALSVALGAARADLPWMSGDFSGQGSLHLTRDGLEVEELRLSVPEHRVSVGAERDWNLGPTRVRLSGKTTWDGGEALLEVRELDLGGLLEARGTLRGALFDGPAGRLEGSVHRVERVVAELAPILPPALGGLMLAGEVPFRLDLVAARPEFHLELELLPQALRLVWAEEGLDARLRGRVEATGPGSGWPQGHVQLGGRLQGTGRFEKHGLTVETFDWDLPLAGRLAAPASPGAQLTIASGRALFHERPLPLGMSTLHARLAAEAGLLRLDDLEVDSEFLGRLGGGLRVGDGGTRGRLEGHDLSVSALVALAGAVADPAWGRWSSHGSVDLVAQVEPGEAGPHLRAGITLRQVGFSSPAGRIMAESLGGDLAVEARPGAEPQLEATLTLGRGEALWDTVYLDLGQSPLDVRARLARTGPQAYDDVHVAAELGGFGRLRLRGAAQAAGGRWRHRGRIELREARLGPIYRTFVREPLAASRADLATLDMDGTAEIELDVSGLGESARLDGRLRVRAGRLAREGQSLLQGLDLDLPVHYDLGNPEAHDPPPPGESGWGTLRVGELRLPGLELGPIETPLALVPNRLYLKAGLDLPWYGGRLSLHRIHVDQPLSPEFQASLAADLEGLDLRRLPFGDAAMEGNLEGRLDPLTIDRERLSATGVLVGDLFGGGLEIGDVRVDRPLHPGREIGADVTVSLLDLEPLSAALGIGRITGRVSGSLRGLRLAYGQPVAFHLRVESVPVRGVRQTVSLKAVNSISVLSTGSGLGGLGAAFMTSVFKQFPYQKIGFECALRNDVFSVRGLIHEDGVEYIVKRPPLGGINVIHRTPGNRIQFSDMVKRLERVTGQPAALEVE